MCLYTYPCLFCGDTKRERTSEHILQKGFGSNWTLPDDVCTECNSKRFSPLDNSLIDFADRFVYPHHPDVLSRRILFQSGHAVSYDEEVEVWQSVRINSNFCPVILPQFVITRSNIRIFLEPKTDKDWKSQVDQIRDELSSPGDVSFKELIVDQPDPSQPLVQPAVIRSQKNKYLLRGASQEDITKLREQIMNGQLLLNMNNYDEPKYSDERIPVASRITVNFADIDRALAKSAVNAVCACLGPDRARQPALQRIKSFALGEISHQLGEFVEPYWGSKAGTEHITRIYGKTGNHTVVLHSIGGVRAFFFLYGKLFASVKLTDEVGFLQPDESFAALLDYKAKTHEMYQLPEDIERFTKRFLPTHT